MERDIESTARNNHHDAQISTHAWQLIADTPKAGNGAFKKAISKLDTNKPIGQQIGLSEQLGIEDKTILLLPQKALFDNTVPQVKQAEKAPTTSEPKLEQDKTVIELEKRLAPLRYQHKLLAKYADLATAYKELETSCFDFDGARFFDSEDKLRQQTCQGMLVSKIDEFFRQYSSGQIEKDAGDPILTPEQQEKITSLSKAIAVVMPYLKQVQEVFHANDQQQINREKATIALRKKSLSTWGRTNPFDEMESTAFDKEMEIRHIMNNL